MGHRQDFLHTPISNCKSSATFYHAMIKNMLRFWLFLSPFFFPSANSFNHPAVAHESLSLDDFLHDLAIRALHHHLPHTSALAGALYQADPPENLEGIEMVSIRIRSKTLWSRGANFSYIHIPQRTLPVPHVRRICLMYLDFGNWSSHYYKVKGYSLVSSVVGFMAFDASNLSSDTVTKLNLHTMAMPIEIQLPSWTLPKESNGRERCARFSANGTVHLSEMSKQNSCYRRSPGFLSVVVPLKRNESVWDFWVEGFVLGFVGLMVALFVGILLVKFVKAKKMHEMEREAEQSVGLETVWIGTSKMPSAAVTRTHPTTENVLDSS